VDHLGPPLPERDGGWLRYAVLFVVAGVLLALGMCYGWGNALRSVVSGPRERNAPSVQTPQGGQPIDPAYFADGSCILYRPTSGNRQETVFLDAGHGGQDPGGVGTTEAGKTVYEADVTLPVELDTMALLRADGYTVVVSRTRASTVLRLGPGDLDGNELSLVGAHDEVAARDICANDAHADLLVGIYFDASSSPYAAGSVTTYDAVRSFSRANLRFAQLLQSSVVSAMNAKGWQIPNDGVLDDVGMGSNNGDPATSELAAMAQEYDHIMLLGPAMNGYFSTPSEMPGALIEPLYITDPFEGSIAANPTDQQVIAGGIATAVERYFGSGNQS
jgi:N-acetylmuramoyl-L-alanine amidase